MLINPRMTIGPMRPGNKIVLAHKSINNILSRLKLVDFNISLSTLFAFIGTLK